MRSAGLSMSTQFMIRDLEEACRPNVLSDHAQHGPTLRGEGSVIL